MLEAIKMYLAQFKNKTEQYQELREYLQLLILKILDEEGYFRQLAFVGGTALRILYDLKRFSEDLDFCLVNTEKYQFATLMEQLKKSLAQLNLNVAITYKDDKTVASAFIKFDELLYALDLSAHKEQKLAIKFEVDQNPPIGFKTELTVINKQYLIAINRYDLPSLYAGKLHAILCRPYAKGRDYYDLLWYLGKKIKPNLVLLENAIIQTEHQNITLTTEKLYDLLREKIGTIDVTKLREDVAPFLQDDKEFRFFDKLIFLQLLQDALNNF